MFMLQIQRLVILMIFIHFNYPTSPSLPHQQFKQAPGAMPDQSNLPEPALMELIPLPKALPSPPLPAHSVGPIPRAMQPLIWLYSAIRPRILLNGMATPMIIFESIGML